MSFRNNTSVPSVAIILMALLLLPVSVAHCHMFLLFSCLIYEYCGGLVSVDNKLIEMAKVYRLSRKKIINGIYIPSLYTYLIAGIRSALGLSFKITVTAEVFNFVKQNTIGAQMYMHRIQMTSRNYSMDQ